MATGVYKHDQASRRKAIRRICSELAPDEDDHLSRRPLERNRPKVTMKKDHLAHQSSTREPTSRYLLVWCLVIGGYIALLALGLLGGFGFIETESNGEAAPALAIFAFAALMIGTMMGMAIVFFERLKARRHDRYIDIRR